MAMSAGDIASRSSPPEGWGRGRVRGRVVLRVRVRVVLRVRVMLRVRVRARVRVRVRARGS